MIKQAKDGICNIRTEANLRRILKKKKIIINYSPDIAGEELARQRGNNEPKRAKERKFVNCFVETLTGWGRLESLN